MRSRTIIFLHGWAMRGAIFRDQIARLGADFRCLAPDLPGHGARRFETPSLDAAAALLHELVRRQNAARVILVGWSMGAAVAWHYLDRFGPSRIAGLVTVDMSPKMACEGAWRHGLVGRRRDDLNVTAQRITSDWPGIANAVSASMFGHPAGGVAFSRDAARRQVLSNDAATMRTCWENLAAADARGTIGRLHLPYLVTSGILSRAYPQSAADWLVRTAPGARGHVFAGSGHSPHLEEPDAFARCIAGFAATV